MNSECNVGWFEIWSSIGFTEVLSVTVTGKMAASLPVMDKFWNLTIFWGKLEHLV